jgi:hypothetical protein
MFVRFRQVRHRLIVNLVETRRVGGKVRSEHIARLGSVALPEPIAVLERARFWRELKVRFRDLADRLANRVSADDRRKALKAVHARIPKPTEADEQAAERDGAIEQERRMIAYWEKERAAAQDMVAEHRKIVEQCEQEIAAFAGLSDTAEKRMRAHQARFLALVRGEPVKPSESLTREDFMRIVKEAGWTAADIRRCKRLADLPEPLREMVLP